MSCKGNDHSSHSHSTIQYLLGHQMHLRHVFFLIFQYLPLKIMDGINICLFFTKEKKEDEERRQHWHCGVWLLEIIIKGGASNPFNRKRARLNLEIRKARDGMPFVLELLSPPTQKNIIKAMIAKGHESLIFRICFQKASPACKSSATILDQATTDS